MRVETVRPNGTDTWIAGLVGLQSERFRSVNLTSDQIKGLRIIDANYSFNGDSQLLKLGLQAYTLGIAYEFDPYFGLSVSRVDPLPHQLEKPVKDPARLEWHEVRKVDHYYLSVDVLSRPMQVREETPPYGERDP